MRSPVATTKRSSFPEANFMSRWNSCNILHVAPDAKRVWSFDAKGGGFALNREQRVAHTEKLPAKGIAKQWSSLWQPKLNVAWLPAENVFLRVVELPASTFEETLAMVELQLEKFSPLPVTQIVWTMHVMGTHTAPAKGDSAPENLQTVIVVIVERKVVEEFLSQLEREGFLADRLETPMLDQLAAITPTDDGAWFFPLSLGGQSAALVAWWFGGVLRNLSFVTLPAVGERAPELKAQLAHLAWSGELEGWLTSEPKWHLVADPVNATEWENVLHAALNEPVQVSAPPAPAELAASTAKRAAAAEKSNLLPAEFTAQYRQQFVDRLWLRGLAYTGLAYAAFLVIYFCAVAGLNFHTTGVEAKVAAISNDYTNALQLKARFGVLQERQQLKYAALDCWQLIAEQLPPGISLQRFSFANGQTVTLSGQVNADDITKIFDFNDALRKLKVNNQQVFNPTPASSQQLSYRNGQGNQANWNFGLELLRTETEPE
jgi:hypothetical protein